MKYPGKRLFKLCLLALCLCMLMPDMARGADFSEGTANFKVRFSDKFAYSDADFVLPLFESPENAAFFINPGAGFDLKLKGSSRNVERFSLGLGQRLYLPGDQFNGAMGGLFDKGIIVGWNGYMDLQYSLYSNFMTRAGVGAEFLSDWVDMRLNTYFRITDDKDLGKKVSRHNYYGTGLYTDRHGGSHEILRSGFDTEIGFRLPVYDQLGEMRIFGGMYYFDTKNVRHISGISTRFEWNPIPFITLAIGWTDSRKLHGEQWNAQLGFQLPFSFNALMNGHNPFSVDFTPKTGNLWHDRYTSQVRRNLF